MPDDFSMFDLPQQDPPAQPDPKPDAGEDRLAALQTELAALRAAQETERRTNQELMARMFAGTGVQPQQQQQPQLSIDLSGLPDPRDDFEGYNTGLAERLGKTMQDMRVVVRDELTRETHFANEQNEILNSAWNNFAERHKELAEFPEIVETATSQVFGELRQRGVEPMRLMQLNMDDVVDQVAARSQQMVDRIRGTTNDNEDDDKPSGRTTMLTGAGSKPRSRGQQQESKPMDFVDNLKKLQSEMRIY